MNRAIAGYVYAIHEVGSDRYKIGRGINVERRLKQLQTGNGKLLTIYATLYTTNYVELESKIKAIFSAYRVLHGGTEWHRLDRQGKHLLDLIFKKEQPTEIERQQLNRLQLL